MAKEKRERRWLVPNKRAKSFAEERKNKVHMHGQKEGNELTINMHRVGKKIYTNIYFQESYIVANAKNKWLVKVELVIQEINIIIIVVLAKEDDKPVVN